jgi:hypothetical protein
MNKAHNGIGERIIFQQRLQSDFEFEKIEKCSPRCIV